MHRFQVSLFASSVVFAVTILQGVYPVTPGERTSKNDTRLKTILERFPSADTNEDGVLTLQEALDFRQQKNRAKKKGERPPTYSKHYKRYEHKSKNGKVLVYYVMQPEKYDPHKNYPLVLALHGRGGSTQAATTLGTPAMRKKYPCFVLAPTSPKTATWGIPQGFREKLRSKEQKLGLVFEVMEKLPKKWSIDAKRIYVTGQSMGGFGTFAAIAKRPGLFAAAVPICGGWDPTEAKNMVKIPLWAFHGAQDKTVPPKLSRDMIAAIKKAGGSPKYTEYPNVGHGSWGRAYATPEMWEWMFEQKK
ncbi:MAG: prolyl oligopeptidase family serine peptidase [Gemmataceae bacterium]